MIAEIKLLKHNHKTIVLMVLLPVLEIIYITSRAMELRFYEYTENYGKSIDILYDYFKLTGLWAFLTMLIVFMFAQYSSSGGWKDVYESVYNSKILSRNEILVIIFSLYVIFVNIIIMGIIRLMIWYCDGKNDILFEKAVGSMLVIYGVLPGILSVIIGLCISTIKKIEWRLVGIIIVYFVLYGGLGRFLQLVSYNESCFDIANIFNLFPTGMERDPDYIYPFQIEKFNIIKIGTWIIFWLMILLYRIKRKYKRNISIILFIGAFAVYIGSKAIPCYTSLSPMGAWGRDSMYYMPHLRSRGYEGAVQLDEAAGFVVDRYDMNINLSDTMNIDAKLHIIGDNEKYIFTLYHGFIVKNVTDSSGCKLNYYRKGDYITIKPEEGQKISEINIKYDGTSYLFYSTSCAVFLPAWFAYYPIPGFRNIYNTESHEFYTNPGYESYYKISVHSPYPVNSQLQYNIKDGKIYTFAGYANGPTLIGSIFVREIKDEGGIRVIYSMLEYSETDIVNKLEKIHTLQKDGQESIVLISYPNIGLSGFGYKDKYHYITFSFDIEYLNNYIGAVL